MALQTVQLIALAGGAIVVTAVVDDADLDTSVVIDPDAGDEPYTLSQARIVSISGTNNTDRTLHINVQGIKATIGANATRTFNVPQNQRIALATLQGLIGG